MFYRLITCACFMAICMDVVYSAAIKGMKAQHEDPTQTAQTAAEVKQSDDHKEEHLKADSDMDSQFDDWLFEYLDTSLPSKPDNLIIPDKRFGFVGSRGKKRHYGFMGSRGKKSDIGVLEDKTVHLFDDDFAQKSLEMNRIATADVDADKDDYKGNQKRAPHFGFHGSRG